MDGTRHSRLDPVARNLGTSIKTIEPFKEQIFQVMEFVEGIDKKFHQLVEEDHTEIFLSGTWHNYISSDLRSLVILALSRQNYQMNIILRHLIDAFVITLWADIVPRFQGSFSYFLETSKWKPYRSRQRVFWKYDKNFPNRCISERIERIRLLNFVKMERNAFYKKYFSSASGCDLLVLLSLPICGDCMKANEGKLHFTNFHLLPAIRKQGKEDMHAVYKSDFGLTCCFCGKQKVSEGFAYGIPEAIDMINMLKIVVDDDKLVTNLKILQEMYSYLSDEFVHFSTTNLPSRKPRSQSFVGKQTVVWGLDGLSFLLKIIEPLIQYYFKRLAIMQRSEAGHQKSQARNRVFKS